MIKSKSVIFFGKYTGENRNRKSLDHRNIQIFKTTEMSLEVLNNKDQTMDESQSAP